jgi:hypothetical protein
MEHAAADAAGAAFAERGMKAELWDHTICHSVYVRDSDGHQVELTTYDV